MTLNANTFQTPEYTFVFEIQGDNLDVWVSDSKMTLTVPNGEVIMTPPIGANTQSTMTLSQPPAGGEWLNITTYLSSSDETIGSLSGQIWTFQVGELGDELKLTVTDDILLGKRPTKMRFRGCNGIFNTQIGFQAKTVDDSIIFDNTGGSGETQICDSFPTTYLTILQDSITWPEGLGDISYFLVFLDFVTAWKATVIEVYIPASTWTDTTALWQDADLLNWQYIDNTWSIYNALSMPYIVPLGTWLQDKRPTKVKFKYFDNCNSVTLKDADDNTIVTCEVTAWPVEFTQSPEFVITWPEGAGDIAKMVVNDNYVQIKEIMFEGL